MNDFLRDNEWQRSIRDRILAPRFYGTYATDGRYVFLDKGKFATALQRRFAVDTCVQSHDGRAVFIEEKIVRWPANRGRAYTDFCLETHSCTKEGGESDGWMLYGQADYLLYCFHHEYDALDCYLIEFQKLKEWFWLREKSFPTFGPLKTLNASMGRLVPILEVTANVPSWRRLLTPVEEMAEVS